MGKFRIALASTPIAILGVAAFATVCFAQQPIRFKIDPNTEVALQIGWTAVDLASDGMPYHVLGQNNDFTSAHSNTTYTFIDPDFNTVFFEPGQFLQFTSQGKNFPHIHSPNVSTSKGADYELQTVRLLIGRAGKSAYVVVATRAFGHSFADAQPVTIELFSFARHPAYDAELGEPREQGEAPSDFTLMSYFVTIKCYHDSNDALENELGMRARQGDRRAQADRRDAPCGGPAFSIEPPKLPAGRL